MKQNNVLQDLVEEFCQYAKEKLGLQSVPKVNLQNDPANAKDPLGKTGYYNPDDKSITIYIMGRHPKDCLRSLSHELVHAHQDENGNMRDNRFGVGEDYFRKNKYVRELEREAYEKGNMILREFEDEKKYK